MRLSEIDLLKFLPDLMQNDADVIAIAAAQNAFYKKIIEKIEVMSRWGKFRQMSERELDFFAEDLYVPWYKIYDDKEVKVNTLEHFVDIWSTIGTPQAIQTVIQDIYGVADLVEWFENESLYKSGEFGIQVGNFAMLSQERKNRLFRILEIVKRKRQQVQTIYTVEKSFVDVYASIRGLSLKNGISVKVAGMYQPDIDLKYNTYTGCNTLVAKTDVSLVIAE